MVADHTDALERRPERRQPSLNPMILEGPFTAKDIASCADNNSTPNLRACVAARRARSLPRCTGLLKVFGRSLLKWPLQADRRE